MDAPSSPEVTEHEEVLDRLKDGYYKAGDPMAFFDQNGRPRQVKMERVNSNGGVSVQESGQSYAIEHSALDRLFLGARGDLTKVLSKIYQSIGSGEAQLDPAYARDILDYASQAFGDYFWRDKPAQLELLLESSPPFASARAAWDTAKSCEARTKNQHFVISPQFLFLLANSTDYQEVLQFLSTQKYISLYSPFDSPEYDKDELLGWFQMIPRAAAAYRSLSLAQIEERLKNDGLYYVPSFRGLRACVVRCIHHLIKNTASS